MGMFGKVRCGASRTPPPTTKVPSRARGKVRRPEDRPPYGAVEENERGKGGRQPSPDSAGVAEPRPYGCTSHIGGSGEHPNLRWRKSRRR